MEERSSPTEGGSPVKPAQEILSPRDPVSKGNTSPTDLISTQPSSAAAPPSGASGALPGQDQQAQRGPDQSTCPQCGLGGPVLPPGRGSSLPVHSSGKRTSSSRDTSGQPATTQSDSCFRLLLACLWCQCPALLLGLLGACSSCLHALCCASCCCSSCGRACARCCAAVREAPAEELRCHAHCHAVLFESCCEPTECLEFCLECCEMCHRS